MERIVMKSTKDVPDEAWFNLVDSIEAGEKMFKELFGHDAKIIYYDLQDDGRYLVGVSFKDII